MAPVLEPLTLSHSSALASPVLSPVLSPVTASSLPSFSGRRSSVTLPQVGGLKIRRSYASRSIESVSSRTGFTHRTGRIVCEAQKIEAQVPAVEDGTWQSFVMECDVPVLVEFWAPWCGPCRMIHPIIDDLAKDYAGKLKFYKVNTDVSPAIATRYGIRSIPTVLIFKAGEKKEAIIGAVPKSTLTTSIEKFL